MTALEKIGAAAVRWAGLELAKRKAWAVFTEAWVDTYLPERVEDDPLEFIANSKPRFERITECASEHEGRTAWVYADHMQQDGVSIAGDDCTHDPLWIRQRLAWVTHKAAAKKAAQARGVVTRMAMKIAKAQLA